MGPLVFELSYFVVSSNYTTMQFNTITNQKAWITREIKKLLDANHNAMKNNNKMRMKQLLSEIKILIQKEKLEYKNKTG